MEHSSYEETLELRSGLTVFPSQHRSIDQVLGHIVENAPARLVLLTDTSGQVISAKGEHGQIDLIALGSLMAGDLAASQEITRILGEYQEYQMILHEGESANTFITEAGGILALLVQLDKGVPLGWARMLTRKAAQRLAEIVDAPAAEEKSSEAGRAAEAQAGEGLEDLNLSDLFGEALDAIWKE